MSLKRLFYKILFLLTSKMAEAKYINCRDALSLAYPDRSWPDEDLDAIHRRWDRYADHYWQSRNRNAAKRGQNDENLVRVADGLSEIVRIVKDWRVEEQIQAIRKLQARLKELELDQEDDVDF